MKKMFQDNSYLTELQSQVITCNKINEKFEVILDKTIFYPHLSGGQPRDIGTINDIKVIDVYEKDEEIVHITSKPINNPAVLKIDWIKRFDYMQQHTGQHILTCAFDNLFDIKTLSFHLGEKYSTIDINTDNLTDDILQSVEIYANKVVYTNSKIDVFNIPYDEASKMNLRKNPPKKDIIRIVKISDFDVNACGGTHTSTTGEVGTIKIRRYEHHKGGTRVEFVCGYRALKDYTFKSNTVHDLSNFLSCHEEKLSDSVIKLYNENKNLLKSIKSLNESINSYKLEELKNSSVNINNINVISKILHAENPKNFRFLISKLLENKNTAAVIVLVSNDKCNLIVGKSKDISLNIKAIFSKCSPIINAKGGGNDLIMQGGGNDVTKAKDCISEGIELIKKMSN